MKRKFISFAICFSAVSIWSCNNSGTSTSSSSDTGTTSATTTNPTTDTTAMNNANTNTTMSNKPLSKADSMFIMEAATGGMMEVEAGKIAQQNAASQRIKDFGTMMVTDHSRVNDELKSFASSRGITVPQALPAAMQKHLEAMKKMKGKAFDKHYVSMMTDDHKKDINKFKQESTGANDADLKSWITKTLPTLETHLDSIQAIKKGM